MVRLRLQRRDAKKLVGGQCLGHGGAGQDSYPENMHVASLVRCPPSSQWLLTYFSRISSIQGTGFASILAGQAGRPPALPLTPLEPASKNPFKQARMITIIVRVGSHITHNESGPIAASILW